MRTRLHKETVSDVVEKLDGGSRWQPQKKAPTPRQYPQKNGPATPKFAQIATMNMQASHGAAAWNLQAVAKEVELCKLYIIFVQETKITNKNM
jgi:hypothetical protein